MPLSFNIPSPAELLNGRTLKSTIPRKIHPPRNQEDFRNWLKTRQDNQHQYYNRHTKELPELHKDQAIYVPDHVKKTWNPAKVISQGDTPRAYIVETETGAQLRRNRIHLRPSSSTTKLTDNSSRSTPQRSTTTTRTQVSSGVNPQGPAPADKPPRKETENCSMRSRLGREIQVPERLNL